MQPSSSSSSSNFTVSPFASIFTFGSLARPTSPAPFVINWADTSARSTSDKNPLFLKYERYVKRAKMAGEFISPDTIFDLGLALDHKLREMDQRHPELKAAADVVTLAPDLPEVGTMTLDQLWQSIKATPAGRNIDEKYHQAEFLDNLRYLYRKIKAGQFEPIPQPFPSTSIFLPHLEQAQSPPRQVAPMINYDTIYSYPTLYRIWMAKTNGASGSRPVGLTRIRQALRQYDMNHPERAGMNLSAQLHADDVYSHIYKLDMLRKLLQDKRRADKVAGGAVGSSLEELREQLRMHDIVHAGSPGSQISGHELMTQPDDLDKITNYDVLVSHYEAALQSVGRQLEYVPADIGELRQAIRDVLSQRPGQTSSSSSSTQPVSTENVKWTIDVGRSRLSRELIDAVVNNVDDVNLEEFLDRLFTPQAEWHPIPHLIEENSTRRKIIRAIHEGNLEPARNELVEAMARKMTELSMFDYNRRTDGADEYWARTLADKILEIPSFDLTNLMDHLGWNTFGGYGLRLVAAIEQRNRAEMIKLFLEHRKRNSASFVDRHRAMGAL